MEPCITQATGSLHHSGSLSKRDKTLLDVALLAGVLLMKSGAEAYRVEETALRILSKTRHREVDVVAIMTGLHVTLTLCDGTYITAVRRIKNRSINLDHIVIVNQISRSIEDGTLAPEEAYQELVRLEQKKRNRLRIDLYTIATGGFFLMMLNGTPLEFLIALLAGVVLVCSQHLMRLPISGSFIPNFVHALAVALVIGVLDHILGRSLDVQRLLTAALMILFPGTTMTNGVRDILKGDYMSGGGNLLEALGVAVALSGGAIAGLLMTGGMGQ